MRIKVKATEDCFEIGFRNKGEVFMWDGDPKAMPPYLEEAEPLAKETVQVEGTMTLGQFEDRPQRRVKVTDVQLGSKVR